MRWCPIALLTGASLCGGCSLVVSLDELGGGSDGSSSDAGDDSGGNLVTNPSFENGAGGCGGNWGNGYGETFTRVSPGHTGSSACDVCLQGTSAQSYQIDAVTPIPVQAGSYYAEAWLATPDGGTPTPVGIQVYFSGSGAIANCNGDGSTYCQGNEVNEPAGTWVASSTTFTVTGTGQVTLDIHSYGGDVGSCFLLDDVALYAQ